MLEILHRSDRLVVLNKPTDVSLLADRSGAACLWDGLAEALGSKPYLVHRLDKGTSGVLLVALHPDTQRQLTRAFQQRHVRKFYLTAVTGNIDGGRTLTLDLPLRKGRKSRYRVAGRREDIGRSSAGWSLATGSASADGKPSRTRIRVLRHEPGASWLLAEPVTGRTHQLRVQLAWIGHPILGDHLYGRPDAPEQRAPRLMLHCHRLVVPEVGTFTAPLPDDLAGHRTPVGARAAD
ncbi:MAG: RNA pseudouridine synthase [Pseudomonadales bacterium]